MENQAPAKDRTELTDGQHQTLAAELAGTRVDIRTCNLFEPIEELQLGNSGQLKRQPQDMAGMLEFDTAGRMVQAKMADADKPIGENMRKETANELEDMEGHQLLFALVAVIEILEGDSILANRHNAVIGNGNAEDVATKILKQLLFVVERWLDIDFPIFGQGLRQHILNIQSAVISVQFVVYPEFGDFKAETIAEHIGKEFDGKEKLVVSRIPTVASGGGYQRAARNDEMDMQMLLHGLPPGMHDHREANLTAEILPTELLQQLSRNLDEQIE